MNNNKRIDIGFKDIIANEDGTVVIKSTELYKTISELKIELGDLNPGETEVPDPPIREVTKPRAPVRIEGKDGGVVVVIEIPNS